MKTTGEVAKELGLKPDKLSRILAKYPGYKPTTKFGGRWTSWTDADIELARPIVAFALAGICPHCGQAPGATTTAGRAADEEATDDAV